MNQVKLDRLIEINRKRMKNEKLRLELQLEHAAAMKWLAIGTPPLLIMFLILYLIKG